jgi:FixJ family two-component response regulator
VSLRIGGETREHLSSALVPIDPPVIFVVDDDISVRKAIRRLLLSLHVPVQTFTCAEEFLAATRPGTRGCLVLDLWLPGMSGLQLQEQLASQEWKLPVVVVTAHDDDEARDASLRLGAIAYIRKPFDRQQFLACVHAAMAQMQALSQ